MSTTDGEPGIPREMQEAFSLAQAIANNFLGSTWVPLTASDFSNFTHYDVNTIAKDAETAYFNEPLIQRVIEVTTIYVWGQGVTISSSDERIKSVIDDFTGDRQNHAEIGEQQGWEALNRALMIRGNLFFHFFPDPIYGHVRIRSVSLSQITKIKGDPNDWKTPLYYLREYRDENNTLTKKYHPDINNPLVWGSTRNRPTHIDGVEIDWSSQIYHVATNCLPEMQFGVSEVYTALRWSKLYETVLKLCFQILEARSRISQLLGDPTGAKKDLPHLAKQLTLPGQGHAATLATVGGAELKPFDVSYGMPHPDYGRRYLLQVCAATGISEPFLAGDSATSNLATATALERPLELQFLDRQELWSSIIKEIYRVVIRWACVAEQGLLHDAVDVKTQRYPPFEPVYTLKASEGEEPVSMDVTVTFPPILKDAADTARIMAIVSAATSGILPVEYSIEQILDALMVPDASEKASELYDILINDVLDANGFAPVDFGNVPTSFEHKLSVIEKMIGKHLKEASV